MTGNAYTVLMVDDSPIILDRINECLRDMACVTVVIKAACFEEAVTVLENNKVNLALLDINLQGKNGIELLSFIKNKYPLVKTIMLTNQSDSYYRNLCEKLGSDSFIDKSNEFDKLTDSVMRYYL